MPALNSLNIRPFTPDDYPAVVAINNTVFPDYSETLTQWKHMDSTRAKHLKWARFVAARNGEPVAYGGYGQREGAYHPQKFHIDITVLPEHQQQGIGSAIYDYILNELEPHHPIQLKGHAQEGRMGGVAFLCNRGFEETMRDWESRLQMETYDPAQHIAAGEKIEAQGIQIKTFSEVMATVPDWKRKLYEMDWTITLDMPTDSEQTKPSFESFEKRILNNPDLLPDGWFIALDGEELVGESALWDDPENNNLYTGATGVLREYRRRGIAYALKARALEYAKNRGVKELKTWNAQSNRAMLSINEALGFLKQPAWISYAKTL